MLTNCDSNHFVVYLKVAMSYKYYTSIKKSMIFRLSLFCLPLDIQLLVSFVEYIILPNGIAFIMFLKSQLVIIVWTYFWVLRSVPLSYVSVPSSVPHSLTT